VVGGQAWARLVLLMFIGGFPLFRVFVWPVHLTNPTDLRIVVQILKMQLVSAEQGSSEFWGEGAS